MYSRTLLARGLVAVAIATVVTVSTHAPVSADALESAEVPSPDERPQALTLLAPFSCGSEWAGSTYSGHGRNNWNLDLNRSGDSIESDLGQPLLAQADGTVVWFKQTGYNNRAGTYVEIDYGDVTVRYIHLIASSIPEHLAEIGAPVDQGETIGLLGATGRVTGPHLHLEYWDSAAHDDAAWYQLPRGNQLPIAFDGQEMVATPREQTDSAISTNCPAPSLEERLRELRLWRYTFLTPTHVG